MLSPTLLVIYRRMLSPTTLAVYGISYSSLILNQLDHRHFSINA